MVLEICPLPFITFFSSRKSYAVNMTLFIKCYLQRTVKDELSGNCFMTFTIIFDRQSLRNIFKLRLEIAESHISLKSFDPAFCAQVWTDLFLKFCIIFKFFW